MTRSVRLLVLLLVALLLVCPAYSAKNVILMIGDGMGYEHVKAGSYYLTGASGGLCFEPYHKCDVTTKSLDNAVTDSAAAATALATGHKTNNGIISQSPTGETYKTILEQAKTLGKRVGLVTTDEITGATPAAFGAHDNSRSSTTAIVDDYLTSSKPDVLFGGGDPDRGGTCVTPAQLTTATQAGYQIVYDNSHMSALDPATAKLSLGLFAGKTMTLERSREASCTEPHLSQMTAKALDLVAGDPDGFFLMIEGACIDKCAHKNDIDGATLEAVEFNNAVHTALTWLAGRNDTLLIVTADHETGGLTVTNNGKGHIPGATWTTGGHTNANVGLYATGADADLFGGYIKNGAIDNTDVYRVMSAAINDKSAKAPGQEGGSAVIIRDFVPEQGICRAQRAITLTATLENTTESGMKLQPRLVTPAGVRVLRSADSEVLLDGAQRRRLSWSIEAQDAAEYKLELDVLSGGATVGAASLDLRFFPPMPIKEMAYIPEPEPVKTSILVGVQDCPLWEAGKPNLWAQVRNKHPERTPALGFYSQENPQVADWETKWAVEHGISFFMYCWYRASQGGPVKMNFGSAIHDALLKSRFVDKMKFTIMWTNHDKGRGGVSDEKDLMTNLMPFWIENYFKHPSYLKIDNKPVLFVYLPSYLVDDLGSVENVRKAFDKMRQACKDAGFDGLYILGEYRGHDASGLQYLKQLGLDYVFAYCWYMLDSPTPEQAVETQMSYIKQTQSIGALPEVVTVSQAWSGWNDEGTIWKIPPTQYEGLLRQAKDYISTFPASELGSKMLLLDNWNEWSEGHYIAPYREYGFGYLDAVRKVFSDAPEKHVDLIPEDIGMGPYDRAYTKWSQEQDKLHNLSVKKVTKKGADEPGLIAWWAFDEAKGSPVALDYSGHRLGGALHKVSRAKGIDGSALDCQGGCVVVGTSPVLSLTDGLTIECWARTDLADQKNVWLVNRVYGGKPSAGYRLGVVDGKPCFEVPQTDWSHHLSASKPLPLGRWAHLAGTFDGKTMRIYLDGQDCGSLDRPGPVNPNDFMVCLGSFAQDHDAHFTGLLDEVKLYDRALSASEVLAHAGRFPTAK